MKLLLLFIVALFISFSAGAANPDYKAFRGAGSVTIVSNPPSGTIVITGSTNIGGKPYHVSTNNGLTDVIYANGNAYQTPPISTVPLTNQNVRLGYFWSGAGGTINQLHISVATAQVGTARFGIYKSIATTNIFPGDLVFGSGTFDVSTLGAKTTNLVTPIILEPNRFYWSAVTTDATGLLVRGWGTLVQETGFGYSTNYTANNAIESISTYGALPNPSALTNYIILTSSTFVPIIWMRFSDR